MISVNLTSIKTRDGIILEGIAVLPKRKTKTALIWVHGLSSRFSSGQQIMKEVSSACKRASIGYFKFNTRGHDVAFRANNTIIGGGFERFEDCVYDIRAMIRFARTLGFTDIILAGHSTGANKTLYYATATKDRSVKSIILLGAISDIVAFQKEMGMKKFIRACAIADTLRKNPHAIMPPQYGLFSARRFWSLCHPGEKEDTFPYYDEKRKWTALESIHIPVAIIIGTNDQYLDRKPTDYIAIFKHHAPLTKHLRGIIIKSTDHGFRKKEKEVAREIVKWIKSTVIKNDIKRVSRSLPLISKPKLPNLL